MYTLQKIKQDIQLARYPKISLRIERYRYKRVLNMNTFLEYKDKNVVKILTNIKSAILLTFTDKLFKNIYKF